jgi:hypothetical protein
VRIYHVYVEVHKWTHNEARLSSLRSSVCVYVCLQVCMHTHYGTITTHLEACLPWDLSWILLYSRYHACPQAWHRLHTNEIMVITMHISLHEHIHETPQHVAHLSAQQHTHTHTNRKPSHLCACAYTQIHRTTQPHITNVRSFTPIHSRDEADLYAGTHTQTWHISRGKLRIYATIHVDLYVNI